MELHAGVHHSEWDAARYNHQQGLQFSENAVYFLVALVVVSVVLTGYVLTLVANQEREERKKQ